MKCECGQDASYQFKNGKWCCSKYYQSCPINRKKNSEGVTKSWSRLETKEKQSKAIKEGKNKPEVKEMISKTSKETWSNPEIRKKHIEAWDKIEVKEKHSKSMKEANNRIERKENQRQFMLNGGSIKAIQGIKNPSLGELKLREIVKELYSQAEYQYKVLNYVIDIALPEHKIAIEYDGWYHFNCQESINYHHKRQKKIETLDWKFLRYNIFQKFPEKEQILNDICNIANGV